MRFSSGGSLASRNAKRGYPAQFIARALRMAGTPLFRTDCPLKSSGSPALRTIPSTYVVTPTGELFHVRTEEDLFGDNYRVATVERCKALVSRVESRIECVDATLLYSCQMRFR
jgi:hypothetical protein